MRIAMMMLLVAMSAVAVIANFHVFEKPYPPDFRQGAYSILCTAEKALVSGDAKGAAAGFKTGMMRAERCGRKGVAARIRNRFATAGFELASKEPAKAFELLKCYVLTAEDFDGTASKVENYILEKTSGRFCEFEYPLVESGGERTFWMDPARRAPVFLYSKLEADRELFNLPGGLTYLRAGELPKNYNYSMMFQFPLLSPHAFKEAELRIDSREERELGVVVGTNDRNYFLYDVANIVKLPAGRKYLRLEAKKDYFGVNSVILFSKNGGRKRVDVTLVRKYEPI